jgi:hypothetical protein
MPIRHPPFLRVGLRTDTIQIDDRRHNWKHYDEHTWHRRSDDHWRHHNRDHRHYDRYDDDRHHSYAGAPIGGVAAGAITNGTLAPHRRHYDNWTATRPVIAVSCLDGARLAM